MKTLSMLLGSLFLAQAVSAAEISCDITRTNQYNRRDIQTDYVSIPFDPSMRDRGVMVDTELRSWLLPSTGQHIVRFEITDRRSLTTQLSLTTYALHPYQFVAGDAQQGSFMSPPAGVVNNFALSSSPYLVEINCNVLN